MEYEDEIRKAISELSEEGKNQAPQSNWSGVLGRAETISITEKNTYSYIKHHKLVSLAASFLIISLIAVALILTLSDSDNNSVNSANRKKIKTATSLPKESTSTSSVPQTEVTTLPSSTTTRPPITSTTKAIVAPSNPTNPQFTGADLVGPPGDPATYNIYFSWGASSTPGVKYCVGTTSEGSSQIFLDCTWNYPYWTSSTSAGFGLVFKQNTTYQFQVTAIDPNNQKSQTVYLNWQLP